MSKLMQLALAAEARGLAQDTLDRARRQTVRIRDDLERQARELVDERMRATAIAAKPGEQLQLPTHDAAYATRRVEVEARRRFGHLRPIT